MMPFESRQPDDTLIVLPFISTVSFTLMADVFRALIFVPFFPSLRKTHSPLGAITSVNGNIPSSKLTYPPLEALLKMIFRFPSSDILVPWRVVHMKITWNNTLGRTRT